MGSCIYDFDLRIKLHSNFTNEQIERIEWYPDVEDDDSYTWFFSLDGKHYQIIFDKDTEEVELETVQPVKKFIS